MPPPIKTTQTILLALVLGILTFSAVVVFQRLASEQPINPDIARLLLVVLAGLAVSETAAYVVLRKLLLARAREARSEALELLEQGKIPLPLHNLAIVGAALAEGAGLLGVIAVMLGGSWFAFAAPALASALIVAQIPTRERLEAALRGGVGAGRSGPELSWGAGRSLPP